MTTDPEPRVLLGAASAGGSLGAATAPAARWTAPGLFGVSFLAYLALISPGIYWRDAGELSASAFGLGIAHPTGFPGYLLLGKLATLMPFGSVAFRINILSALSAATAVTLSRRLILRFSPEDTPVTRSVAVAIALILAFGQTLWLHATTAEVYAPNLVIALGLIGLSLSVWETGGTRPFRALAVLTGVAAGFHASIAFTALAVWPIALAGRLRHGRAPRRPSRVADLLWTGLLALAAAGVLAYLPLRAATDPWRNWGDPQTLAAIWEHLSGARIRAAFSASMGAGAATSIDLANATQQLVEQVSWLAVPAVFGLLWLGLRRATRGLLLLSVLASDLAFTVLMNPMGMVDRQTGVITTAATLLAAGVGLSVLGKWLLTPQFSRRGSSALAVALALGLGAPAIFSGGRVRDTRRLYQPMDAADKLYDRSPPHTLLLVTGDDLASATTYAQGVENRRPDCTTVVRQHILDGSYIGKLRRVYGDEHLTDAFLKGLPAAPSPVAAITALLSENRSRRPILWELGDAVTDALVAQDLKIDFPMARLNFGPAIGNLTARFIETRLRWRAMSGRAWHQSALNTLARSFSLAGSLLLQRGERERAKIAIHDAMMSDRRDPQVLNNYAILLESEGKLRAARQRFQEVVSKRPTYGLGWYNLGMSWFRTGDLGRTADAFGQAARLGVSRSRLAAAAYRLAVLHANAGSYERAFALLQRAIPHLSAEDRASGLAMRDQLATLLAQKHP